MRCPFMSPSHQIDTSTRSNRAPSCASCNSCACAKVSAFPSSTSSLCGSRGEVNAPRGINPRVRGAYFRGYYTRTLAGWFVFGAFCDNISQRKRQGVPRCRVTLSSGKANHKRRGRKGAALGFWRVAAARNLRGESTPPPSVVFLKVYLRQLGLAPNRLLVLATPSPTPLARASGDYPRPT